MTVHREAPRRALSLIMVLVFFLALVGIVQGANLLRHPLPDELPPVPEADELAADPRTEIVCEEPQPIEGQERADDDDAPAAVGFSTSNDLLDCPQTYHQHEVRFRGEVVGSVLRRDDGAWVQLNDDVYALARGPLPAHRDYRGANSGLGVFIPLELADEIEVVGGPRVRGDVLEVAGEFRRVDAERREAAVIIASEGALVGSGSPIDDPVLPARRWVALGLALLAGVVALAERVVARRR